MCVCVIVAGVLLVLCCSHCAGSGGVKTAGWAAAAGKHSGCSWCCLIPAETTTETTETSETRQHHRHVDKSTPLKGQCVGFFF